MEDFQQIIIEQIKSNKLETLDYEMLLSQLTVLNNKPYGTIKELVDKDKQLAISA
mgnify:CR=1 FL=1